MRKQNKFTVYLKTAAAVTAAALFLSGCSSELSGKSSGGNSLSEIIESTASITDSDKRCEKILGEMTTEQKIGQMIVAAVRSKPEGIGDEGNTDVTELTDTIRESIEDCGYGGIILFNNNFETTSSVTTLIYEMQQAAVSDRALSGIPMFMAVDEEGGTVNRITSATQMPGNMALGAAGSEEVSASCARIIGKELNAIGISMNFAPVLDINSNPGNPVIGVRSFSDDPELTASLGTAFMKGLQEENVIPCVKHFPGHGDTDTDSHTGLPLIDKNLDELRELELVPFQRAIDNGAEVIMTAHIQFPQIETNTYVSVSTGEEVFLPATLSEKVVGEILRKEMGYDGIVITDALNMSAISDNFDPLDAAALAVNAGVDMLLMPVELTTKEDFKKQRDYITSVAGLVESGVIREEEVNDSVLRILKLKDKYGILDSASNYSLNAEDSKAFLEDRIENAKTVVGSAGNHATEWEITEKTITVFENTEDTLPLNSAETSGKNILFLTYHDAMGRSVEYAEKRLREEGLISERTSFTVCPVYNTETGTFISSNEVNSAVKTADIVIVCSLCYSDDSLNPETEDGIYIKRLKEAVKTANQSSKKTIAVSCRLPYDAAVYSRNTVPYEESADAIVLCYGYASLQNSPETESDKLYGFSPNLPAAICAVFGEFQAEGTCPVKIPEGGKK